MSKRILVVEDQPDNRQIIRDMLSPTDYEITEAENGEEARSNREAAAQSHPDGYPIANHGRLYRHAPHQSRSRLEIDPDHRGHLLCAQRLRKDCSRGLCAETLQPAPTAGENSAISGVT